ncbi:hypothetical protein EV361DRAFT_1035485 [Lentinula raphanica]|nr:hypothetical protein EV361DRAFT_1035485 [Lentinula raphanica]
MLAPFYSTHPYDMEQTDEAKDWKHITLLPIKEAEDGSNNYNEFKRKSMFELDAAGYWKYINGADYKPPQIPVLQPTQEMRGLDVAGNLATFKIPGNEAEVQTACDKAKIWIEGDKKALAIIVKAVPVERLYLLKDCSSAHAAWIALKNKYEPTNTLSALTIMQQIISNQCKPDDDPVAWLEDEEVELGIAPYITSLNTIMATSKGKSVGRNNQVVPGVYSASETANNTSGSRQLHRDDRRFKPYSDQRRGTFNNRPMSSFNPNLICENPYCVFAQVAEKLDDIQPVITDRVTCTYRPMRELQLDADRCWRESEEGR